MGRHRLRLLALALLPAALACGGMAGFDRVERRHMGSRLAFAGFSFAPPPGPQWYLLQSEQTHASALLRRDGAPAFHARVSLGWLPSQPGSHAGFGELARAERAPTRDALRTAAYEQALATRQGLWCIRFAGRYRLVGAVGDDRTLVERGYRCLHPAWAETSLDFSYVQIGRSERLDPALSAGGEAFLRGVRIEFGPEQPAHRPAQPPRRPELRAEGWRAAR